ncbi:MAG TPA: nucleobase:cation symporter-2 family protein [Flexivirga sp.]|uniref:nucleobase:cation symporter-2 family protein n=1 Tax=Flexivirga sp. TaxID=1962927 RepID=UPI002CF18015|nr:nucleobase:cation symporter-2 family protein [Flexivirga sp.]HWC23175.1 nucleobase:cation symporter-2 family protein [Flexivirga sp.]
MSAVKLLRREGNPMHQGRPEDTMYGPGRLLIYGTQHILTMYGGVIAPPIIIGGAAHLKTSDVALLVTAGLFISGIATLLQTLGFGPVGSRLPIVQGVSFASVSTMVSIASKDGVRPVLGAIIVAGLIGVIASTWFAKIVRFFPAVVTGSIITVIGASLMPTAFTWCMGGDPKSADFGSPTNIGYAGLTLLIIVLISRLFQGAVSRLSILIGMIIGTIVAAATGHADFSGVQDAKLVALPQILHFGSPTFQVGAIISMTIVIFVIMTETTADILAIGEIVGTEVDDKRVAAGLRADMAATTVAPFFGSFPASAFAQNVGLVALTGIKSRFAVAAGGGVLVVLGLLPVVGAIVAGIPSPVLGGAGIILFGSVTASGIRTLARVDFENGLNLVIISVTFGFGVIPIAMPTFWDRFPDWFGVIMDSGISAAAISAVTLNLFFNEWKWGNRPGASVFAERDNRVERFGDRLEDDIRRSEKISRTAVD